MKKNLSLLLSIMLFFSMTERDVFAEVVEKDMSQETINVQNVIVKYDNNTILSDYAIEIKQVMKMNDTTVPLYCQFSNNEDALEKIKIDAADVLQVLMNTYSLDTLSEDNWKEYSEYYLEYLDADNKAAWYTEENLQFRKLRHFFDIYENEQKNKGIVSEINSGLVKSVDDMDFLMKLPYGSAKKLGYPEAEETLSLTRSSFSTDAAISYAKSFATLRNNLYESFSEDCTNFASQIMAAGGQSQEMTNSVYSGWWHRYSGGHQHSHSWTVADDFMVYFGISGGGVYHRSFSTSLRAGDFIAADYEDDGDWDHLGFVVEKSSGLVTSNASTYYDYKVAQHSSDYCRWVSADNNGWETIGIDGGRYAYHRHF